MINRLRRAFAGLPAEMDNRRGQCPQCRGPLVNQWPAYPGASHQVCGDCAVRR